MLVSVELVLQVSALACMPMVVRLNGNAMMIQVHTRFIDVCQVKDKAFEKLDLRRLTGKVCWHVHQRRST